MRFSRRTEPDLPRVANLPAPVEHDRPVDHAFAPARKRYSEEAMRQAQYVEDLQRDNQQLREEISAHATQRQLWEGANDRLREEIDTLREQRDHYHNRCVGIETKMGLVANILAEVLGSSTSPPTPPLDSKTADAIDQGVAELNGKKS